jgi:hypothetical protein
VISPSSSSIHRRGKLTVLVLEVLVKWRFPDAHGASFCTYRYGGNEGG